MNNFHKKVGIILLVFIFLFTSVVLAEKQLPIGLQKIIEYNQQFSTDFSLKISFFIAFVAGLLGILSPCILPFLPAYFSYTFKEKKNITLMTLVFFVGFSLVFVMMGVIAGYLGEQSLLAVQKGWMVSLAGILLITMGVLTLLGKGFSSFVKINHKFSNDIFGVFVFGLSFAVGWTACLGPILAGILGIGAILHNPWHAAILLFFYSLGNLVPLFILAMLYDKYNFARGLRGKVFSFRLFGKTWQVHIISLISGILFLVIGLVFLINQNTALVNTLDLLGTRDYFYSLQNQLIAWKYAQPASITIFFLFIFTLIYFLWKHKKTL